MRRCTCDRSSPTGPTTHHGAAHHDARCRHSELRRTTKKFKKHRPKPILGTRRFIAIPDDL